MLPTPICPTFFVGLLDAADLRWLDVLGLATVVFFTVIGAWRGLWWQLVRLLGIVASIAVARAAAPQLAPWLQARLEGLDPRIAYGLVWTLVLFLGLVVVSLVGRAGKEAIEAAHVGLVDRFGGAVAGFLSGLLLHAAIVLCLCTMSARSWSVEIVQGTRSQRLVDALGREVPLFLDAHAAESLEPWLERH